MQSARRSGFSVGLVPTMGALHEGHLSLIRAAREQCDLVVLSLFVNPTQFDEASDLSAYPREENRDAALASGAGADILFAPSVAEVYPDSFATTVSVAGITHRLEGAIRGVEHFEAVATVVLKLLNMTTPNVAYFGQKDAQQVVVIRALVRDLNVPVRIEVCPTVREPDGLAMSSRNTRLRPDERVRALALHRGLAAANELAATGEHDAPALLRAARTQMAELAVEPEYLELVDPATLEPVKTLDQSALLLVAARVGETRLIDNAILEPAPRSRSSEPTEREEPTLCSA